MKDGFSGLTSEVQFPIPAPPERNIVLVPSQIAEQARKLRDAGQPEQALTLLEKNIWARIR